MPSGKLPLSPEIHAMRGTRSGPHVRPSREPRGRPGTPAMPAEIERDVLAAAHWAALVAELRYMRVLHKGHRMALAGLATTLADWERARLEWEGLGRPSLTYVTAVNPRTGSVHERAMEHPLPRRIERLATLSLKLLGHFGLTPSTSASVHAQPQQDNPIAAAYVTAPAV